MRPKSIRLIESIHNKGVFGSCSCGGQVLYYTDKGVRCSTCGKLYGVWANRHRTLIQRAKDLLEHTKKLGEDDEYSKSFAEGEVARSTEENDVHDFLNEDVELVL